MNKFLRGSLAAGLFSASLFVAPAATAQDTNPYVQVVVSQLEQLIPLMAERGFPNHELVAFNAINNGANETFNYSNNDAREVVFVGVCDQDCSDLDLRVRGSQGLVGEDVLTDDHPMVAAPPGARPLVVNVIMAACSQNPCVYGVAVFRR